MHAAQSLAGGGRTIPTARTWVASHAVAAYLVLTYLISWLCWVPLALTHRVVQPGVGWPSHMPGLVGPALAATIVTAIIGGRAGVSQLWRRVTRWRIGWWWMSVVACLMAGAIGLAFAGRSIDPKELTTYNGIGSAVGPIATILLVFAVNGIGEELGWRGFLADHFLHRHSLVKTSLLVALAWAPWHLPFFFFLGTFQGFGVGEMIGWALGLACGSIVLTYLYRGSGSGALLVAVWHTAFNFTSATPAARGAPAAISSTLVMLAAIAIVVANRKSK